MAKARFVSRYGAYSVGIRPAVQEHLGHDGKMVPHRRRLDANFSNKLVNDDDLKVAVSSFVFTGLPEDTDTNEHISPRWRTSVWDSQTAALEEGWSDEEIDAMIGALRASSAYGLDHIEVEVAPLALPFPNYDDLSVDEVLQLVKLTGIDAASVAAYERENKNRDSLLKRLEGVEVDADGAVVVNAG